MVEDYFAYDIIDRLIFTIGQLTKIWLNKKTSSMLVFRKFKTLEREEVNDALRRLPLK